MSDSSEVIIKEPLIGGLPRPFFKGLLWVLSSSPPPLSHPSGQKPHFKGAKIFSDTAHPDVNSADDKASRECWGSTPCPLTNQVP